MAVTILLSVCVGLGLWLLARRSRPGVVRASHALAGTAGLALLLLGGKLAGTTALAAVLIASALFGGLAVWLASAGGLVLFLHAFLGFTGAALAVAVAWP